MPLTDTEIGELGYELVQRIYVTPNKTSTHTVQEIKAAMAKIDTAMNATGQQIVNAGYGATALEQALLAECQSAAPDLTVPEAAIALMLWTAKRAGLLG